MFDNRYILKPKIDTGETNVGIYKDGQFIKNTPVQLSTSLYEIAQKGGTETYEARKTNFTSEYKYKLFLIQNPDFINNYNDSNPGPPNKQLQQVISEYGTSIKSFSSVVVKNAPSDLYSSDGLNDGQFRGNPGDRDSYSFEERDAYSSIPKYIIAVLRYTENDYLDEGYLALTAQDGDFDIDLNFKLRQVEPTDEGGDTETPPESNLFELDIRVDGEFNSVILVVDGERTILTREQTNLSIPQGSKVSISSSDISLYRLQTLDVTRTDSNGSTNTPLKALQNESIVYSFEMNSFISILAKTQSVTQSPRFGKPFIALTETNKKYNLNSGADLPIGFNIPPFNSVGEVNRIDSVRIIIGDNVKTFSKLSGKPSFIALISKDVFTQVGNYQCQIIPSNDERGDGDVIPFTINVISEVFVGEPDIRNIKYPREIFGADFSGYNIDFKISYESINTDYVELGIEGTTYTSKVTSTGIVDLNYGELINLSGVIPDENGNSSIILNLTPYNTSGIKILKGITEQLPISFIPGQNQIPTSQAVNRLVDAFISKLNFGLTTESTSKLLTHTLHLGDGDNKVISNWTGSEDTLILKLYEPLPTSVQDNQQVWISKMESNPIIETVTLSGGEELVCTPIKGPNFSLSNDSSLGYQIYDELIASGSATSDQLINKYFDGLNIDTTKLDIQYVSGSTWMFENFVNFGSAEERVNNFFYKVQLIENYVSKLNSLNDGLELGQLLTELAPNDARIDGLQSTSPVFFTEDDVFNLDVEQRVFRNPSEKIESERVTEQLRTLLASFDGFENFLYSSTNELSWPKVTIKRPVTNYPIIVLKNSNDSTVVAWYESLISLASQYDRNNINYLVNNIPLFIKEDSNNSEFLLFLDMIGQHFDVIWVYINGLKRLRKNDEAGIKGVPKEFVNALLKSFGWDGKRAYDSQFLWEYALGQYKDGKQKYSTSLEDANNQVWKRILNNLPYLLKHKGTARSMKAIMATYGVPQSMLTIMEFGGPKDPTQGGGSSDFTFDDRTAALHLYPTSSVDIHWKSVSGEYPKSIEFMIKPHNLHSSTILSSSNFTLDIIQTGSKAYLEFDLDGEVTQSLPFKFATDNYSGILISKNTSDYEVFFKTSDGERVYVTSSLRLDSATSLPWESEDVIKIGNDFTGALDEVRLWRVPLEETKFENHVLYPNAINGNSYTASTSDLLFRLDFEYPIDVFSGTSTIPSGSIKNVAINTSYGLLYATSSNFNQDLASYPYSYIPYDRTVTTKVPSLGFNYSNKIRSESQTLVTNLSYKKRATKKAFDRAPIDSNRLGLFFSPIKELNMDIVKSIGDFNIDNYIGNPSDEYKDDYSELKTLRNYYFERINRNSFEYIRLIKYISKSLFDVLADLAPARAKVSKGLLIEPHFLERSKVRWDKPSSLRGDYLAEITASENTFFTTQKIGFEGLLDTEQETNLVGDEKMFDTIIDIDNQTILEGLEKGYDANIVDNLTSSFSTEYLYHTASIVFEFTGSVVGEYDSLAGFTQVGMDANSLANLGFGLFAEDTTMIWNRYDIDYTITSSRSDVYLLERTLTRDTVVQVSGYPTIGSVEGDQISFEVQKVPYVKKEINILPYGSTAPATTGNVTKVSPLKGYFPTHYRFVNGLSTGLERSFYLGSTQTSGSTPDGLSPVEIFTTNPNVLRVTDTGRGSGEPILEVD